MNKNKIKKGLVIASLAIQTLSLPHTSYANSDSNISEGPSFLLVEQSKKPEVNSLSEIILKNPTEDQGASLEQFVPKVSILEEVDVSQTPDQPKSLPVAPQADLSTIEGIRQRICEVFPAGECENALTIVYHESKFDIRAFSSTGDRGLFQINCYWHKNKVANQDCQQFEDPETNIQIAYQIWSAQGWCPWSTRHYIGVSCGYY